MLHVCGADAPPGETVNARVPEPVPLPPGPVLVQLHSISCVPAVKALADATQALEFVAAQNCWWSSEIGPTPLLPGASPCSVPVIVSGCPSTGATGLKLNPTLQPVPV